MKPVRIVKSTVSTMAGRRYLLHTLCQRERFGAFSAAIAVVPPSVAASVILLISITFFLPHAAASVSTGQAAAFQLRLECQVQHLQHQIDQFDADEGGNDAANAVDQQVTPQQQTRSNRAILDAAQSERYQGDDDEGVEDHGR